MEIAKWTAEIDAVTSAFRKEFGQLTKEELNAKPAPGAWSIAQNMDHLITINETYFPIIHAAKEDRLKLPFIARIPFMVNFLGRAILSAVSPDRRKKMKTFPVWEPASSMIEGDILGRFAAAQERLKVLIQDALPLLEKRAVIHSPANRNIVYTVATAFDIIVTHEKRHLEQAREAHAIIVRLQAASTPS